MKTDRVDQDSMPIAFVSTGEAKLTNFGDSARRICARYDIDPDAIGWPDPIGAESAEFVRERIGAAALFIGVYQSDVQVVNLYNPDGSTYPVNKTDFDLNVACDSLKPDDVLCFLQKNITRTPDLEALLARFAKKYTLYEFDEQRDLRLTLDQAIKDWRGRMPRVESGPVMSIQVECRDRYGVLSVLADRIFREGGNIERAEHRNHLHRAGIRLIASWPVREKIEPDALKSALARSLSALLGADDASITVASIVDGDGVVETRTIFDLMYWDGPGVAERIFAVFVAERFSIVESRLISIPASPPLGHLTLTVDSSGSTDMLLGLMEGNLRKLPNVFMVKRSTERGKWWY